MQLMDESMAWMRVGHVLGRRLAVPEKQTHDYVGHATTTLLAALEIVAALFPEARARMIRQRLRALDNPVIAGSDPKGVIDAASGGQPVYGCVLL